MKMSFRSKIITLSAAIVILAATYFLGGQFSNNKKVDRLAMEPMFDMTLKDSMTALKVDTVEGALRLEKISKDQWIVRIDDTVTYPASAQRANSLVDSVFAVTKYKLMGHGEKYWEEFELEPNRADAVEIIKDGETMFTLYVGKEGPGRKGDYVRSSLSDEIYLTDATMQRHFGKEPKYWFSMRLFPDGYIGEDMFAYTIINNMTGERLSLKKDRPDRKGQWENLAPGGAVPTKFGADTIANKIATIEGDNFINGEKLNPNYTIECDSAEYGHIIFDCQKIRDGENYMYVMNRRGDSYMYLVSEDKLLPIFQPTELFENK